jgi:hypothetical protein
MRFSYDDGGRAAAGFKGTTGDCVCRAIAIATERPYREVYDLINEYAKSERKSKRKRGKSNARTGVYKDCIRKVMDHYGWTWVPTMQIGQGCKVHLKDGELPVGRLVVSLSKHETAVIDGVIHDIYDPSRDGTRCVYGYYVKEEKMASEKYKIGWKTKSGAWRYLVVNDKGEALAEVADKMCLSDRVSVKRIGRFSLEKGDDVDD